MIQSNVLELLMGESSNSGGMVVERRRGCDSLDLLIESTNNDCVVVGGSEVVLERRICS